VHRTGPRPGATATGRPAGPDPARRPGLPHDSRPAGYLVVHADAARRLLVIKHYPNDGLLTAIIEAATDGYTSVLEVGLVSRLDHAAYLGRERARAEHALATGTAYRQDAAPGSARPREFGADSGEQFGP
jgi:hypothetical protein